MKTLNLTLNAVLLAVMVAVTGYAQETKVEKPKALVKAQEAYEKEAARVLEPVNMAYLKTLESLKRDMGVRGDTAGMVAVQAEIDEVKEYLKNEAGTEEMLVGKWSTLRTSDGYRDTLTFNADHTMRAGNSDHGTWKVKNGKWRAIFASGLSFEALLPSKAKMTVSHSDGSTWTFEKQK